MGGDKGGTRKGRKNEGGSGEGVGVQGGTLGRDQQKKPPRVLLENGKIAPGTRAYAAKKK